MHEGSGPSSSHEWLIGMIIAGAAVGMAGGLGSPTSLSIPFGALVGATHGFFFAPIALRTIGRKPVIPACVLISLPAMGVALMTAILLGPELAWGASVSMAIIAMLGVGALMPDLPPEMVTICPKCGQESRDRSVEFCPRCGAALGGADESAG